MLNRATNCILISFVICKVIEDKNLSHCLFFPSWFASFHPSKALRSNIRSLHINMYKVGVCRKPTNLPNPTHPTWPIGLGWFLGLDGLGWVTKKKIYSGLGWVWVIKLQTRQTQPDPPIFNKKILKPAIGHLYIYI